MECDYYTADGKFLDGTLEQSDVVNCYRPQCDPDTDQYIIKQCSFHFPGWCWCSSPNGYAIPGTFQRNMPEGYCGMYIATRQCTTMYIGVHNIVMHMHVCRTCVHV